jgi:hypothetical protein
MLLACSFDIAIIRGFLWFTVALAVGLAVNQILTLFRNYLESVHIESRIMSTPSSCYPDPVPIAATWPSLYQREAARIRSVLSDRVLRIERAGFPAVPGQRSSIGS